MNPEALSRVLALIAALVGSRRAQEHEVFARAIVAATDNPAQQRLLVAVAWGENWFHPYSYPPFGLTGMVQINPRWCWGNERMPERRRTWRRPQCEILTVAQAAPRALLQLGYARRVRCAPGASDADVLKRYGWGGACVANRITSERMATVYEHTRHWNIP
jgi:hypothetical protein